MCEPEAEWSKAAAYSFSLGTMYNSPFLFMAWVRIKVDQYIFILFKPLSHFAYGYSLI